MSTRPGVAKAADVAVQTVFNHFPTKEDLFFDQTGWWTGPAEAIRQAAPGDDVVGALKQHYQQITPQEFRWPMPTVR